MLTLVGIVTEPFHDHDCKRDENGKGEVMVSHIDWDRIDVLYPKLFHGNEFVSYSEVMDALGVPKEFYEDCRGRLSNGKRICLEDRQLGWGPNGFGYYIMTYIPVSM